MDPWPPRERSMLDSHSVLSYDLDTTVLICARYDLVTSRTTVRANSCSREQLFARTVVRERVELFGYCHDFFQI